MAGAARKNKIAGLAFAVGALSMIGVPLFAGFPSKFYLANAAMQGSYGTWIAVIVLALSTFLNGLYYAPALFKIYSGGGHKENAQEAGNLSPEEKKTKGIAAPTLLCLMAANVALGIFYVPLLRAIERGFAWLG
jgi:multicomponent Na+:H+ antiporter subunit D